MVGLTLVLMMIPGAVEHRVGLEHDHVVVDSRFALDHAPEGDQLPLVVALPASAEVDGARAVRDADGSIVALAFPVPSHGAPRELAARVRVPLAAVVDSLPVPIADVGELQRMRVDDALVFTADAALGLEARIGRNVARDASERERVRLDAALDRHGGDRARPGAFYLRPAQVARTGGVRGRLTDSAQVRARIAAIAALVFGGLLGTTLAWWRRTRSRAEAERAEQLLAEDFAVLEAHSRGGSSHNACG